MKFWMNNWKPPAYLKHYLQQLLQAGLFRFSNTPCFKHNTMQKKIISSRSGKKKYQLPLGTWDQLIAMAGRWIGCFLEVTVKGETSRIP